MPGRASDSARSGTPRITDARNRSGGKPPREGRDRRASVQTARLLHLLPLLRRVKYLAGLAAVVVPDDAVLRHEVDQPRRPPVADAQRPLEQRDTPPSLADNHLDRRLVQLVAGTQRI